MNPERIVAKTLRSEGHWLTVPSAIVKVQKELLKETREKKRTRDLGTLSQTHSVKENLSDVPAVQELKGLGCGFKWTRFGHA